MMKARTTFAMCLLGATILAGAAQAKTLIYCSEASPEGFDPGLFTAGTTFDASSRPVYNRLVEFKPGTTEVAPSLAEGWIISDDGLQYTFKLRPNVRFQTTGFFTPTRDLNADDVVYSFERQFRGDHPWAKYIEGGTWEYFNSMGFPKLVSSVEKIDEMTVRFTLTRKEAPFLADLAMDFASILSKEYADKLQSEGKMAELNQKPLGTGPFAFVDYQQDQVIRYKANTDYWRGKVKIDDLIFAIATDASVRLQKLKAGECHIFPYPNAADVAAIKADTDLTLMEESGLNIAYLAYNTLQAPFDKPQVRKALNMAINKQAIVDAVFAGAGTVAKNPIPPTMWSYNNAVENDKYDPAAAKAALEASGVKDLSMKIWAMPVSRPYMLNAPRAAEILQADFAAVGVKAEIVTMEWAEYLEKTRAKDRDGAVMLGWTGDNGDPDNFLNTLLSCGAVGGNNRAQWCNEEFDALLKKAKESSDQAERTRLYEEAQVIFKREAPWATLDHSLVSMPMSKKVTGYVMSPFGFHDFQTVDIAE